MKRLIAPLLTLVVMWQEKNSADIETQLKKLAKLTFCLLALLAVWQAKYAFDAETKIEGGTLSSYIRSAECARTTGKVLVLCDGGRIRPISDESAADDPGHALAIGLYSAITGRGVDFRAVSAASAAVNIVGIFLLVGALLWMRLPIVAMTFLILGPVIWSQHVMFAVHTAMFGATCLAMIPVLVILTISAKPALRHSVAWAAVAIASLALATIFRQAIGLMGFVGSALAIIWVSIREPKSLTRTALHAVLLIAAFAAYKAPAAIFALRDYAYGFDASTRMETHGIWHAIYCGLGAVKNPFGIEWLDENAMAHALAIDPTAQYGTQHYFEVLKNAYFDLVIHNPLTIARIYIEKLLYAIAREKVWIMLLLTAVPAMFLRSKQRWPVRNIDSVITTSGIFICFFFGQAALIHWSWVYLFPIKVPLALMFGVAIDLLVRAAIGTAISNPLSLE